MISLKLIKKYIVQITAAVSFLIFLCLFFALRSLSAKQATQTMADRWSKDGGTAQVSCFFSINGALDQDRIEEFEHALDTKLEEASITVDNYGLKDGETRNANARLWVDAYSADGRVSIKSTKATVSVQALGVGGDFFMFHPLELLNGAFFSGDALMQDYIVLDEDAAWQLFGSNDIAGQIVTIGGVPHVVSGVIRRQGGKLYESAGLSESLVYVSYETLVKYGTVNYGSGSGNINHYEIVMPNPVKGFALGIVRENFGSDGKNVELIENTSRFSFGSIMKVILSFGTRSMNGKAIIYPYWENVARGYEDIMALLLVLGFLFFLYPAVTVLVILIRLWKGKGWTVKEKFLLLKDKAERFLEKQRAKKRRKDYFEEEML